MKLRAQKRQDRRIAIFCTIAVVGYSCSVLLSNLLHEDMEAELKEVKSAGHSHSPPAHPFPIEAKQGAIKAGKEPMWVETISESPRIVVIHNMLSHSECDHLINLAKAEGMDVALIQPYGSHELVPSSTRTNTQAWLEPRQDAIVADIEDRIAEVSGTTQDQGENLQVLNYKVSQQFHPHHDFFDPVTDPPENFAQGGNRLATIVIYLHEAEEGGETEFPELNLKLHLTKGDAVLWRNLHEDCDGTDPDCVDRRTEHAGRPPTAGEKWVATKWIHERSYKEGADETGLCFDRHPKCTQWVKADYCSLSSQWMHGHCARACGFCSPA
eukprot:CAMPEP_0177710196 /NCGR_PEP_ID=MMETSP0484_2-20121128/11206_1 /TAXON_ID=354590 /ORGANISM="Rhodomonas lens, Strain RHODO" /LENGTH=325 /DNA_ID=CAMNT_0019221861 /DNA_START=352 /DNA_END=1329 /DNA_ORIENTATION=-